MRNKLDAAWPTIMVVGAFAAGVIYANVPLSAKWQPGWEMVSGLGTTAAAIVALWISGREERRIRQQEKVQAIIIAARIYLPLASYTREVKTMARYFTTTPPHAVFPNAYDDRLATTKRLLDTKVVEGVDLGLLAGLGDNTAILIASAYGYLHASLTAMKRAHWDFMQAGPSNIEGRKVSHQIITLALNNAAKQLLLATERCDSASKGFTRHEGGVIENLRFD